MKISFSLGGNGDDVRNNVIIYLPQNIFVEKYNFQSVCDIFKKIINIANPYFAFMTNSMNKNLSSSYWKEKPTYVHTLNYFGEDTAQKIGIDKLNGLQNIERLNNGWYLKLLDEPLDVDNPLHLEKQKQISEFLGLID